MMTMEDLQRLNDEITIGPDDSRDDPVFAGLSVRQENEFSRFAFDNGKDWMAATVGLVVVGKAKVSEAVICAVLHGIKLGMKLEIVDGEFRVREPQKEEE